MFSIPGQSLIPAASVVGEMIHVNAHINLGIKTSSGVSHQSCFTTHITTSVIF